MQTAQSRIIETESSIDNSNPNSVSHNQQPELAEKSHMGSICITDGNNNAEEAESTAKTYTMMSKKERKKSDEKFY